METKKFDVEKAVEYAYKWALHRNPLYFNFEYAGLGGDCTNFISQCIYAGGGIMNFTKDYGWYYENINKRSPAWTGVQPLYNFLTGNRGRGPFGNEITIEDIKPGDIIQLSFDNIVFSHALFVILVKGLPSPANILIACHTRDALLKPLSEYIYQKIRYIRIEGIRGT